MNIMKPSVLAVLTTLSVLLVTGCSKDAPVQTVEWWKDHKTERTEMLYRCANNPGELGGTPNCVNAAEAETNSVVKGTGYGVSNVKAPTFKQ